MSDWFKRQLELIQHRRDNQASPNVMLQQEVERLQVSAGLWIVKHPHKPPSEWPAQKTDES